MKNRVFESIISATILFIITALINLIVISSQLPRYSISISDLNQISPDEIVLTINIKNNFEHISDSIMIQIPQKISEKEIYSNKPIDIKIKNNDTATTLKLDEIGGYDNVSLVLKVDEKMDTHDVIPSSEDSKMKIQYLADDTTDIRDYVLRLLLLVLITSTIFGIMELINALRKDKIVKRIREEIKQIESKYEDKDKELQNIQSTLSELKLQSAEIKSSYYKEMMILKKRIRQYDKELSFWRNTIRKMLYKSEKTSNSSEDIISLVTNELKTYQTNCKDNVCLENIKAMSEISESIDSL